MIELKDDQLIFSFPEVHPKAKLTIDFQRTLRIPDDGKVYLLPPELGVFPLKHVDDFPDTVPEEWLQHGGVMLPMYQSEALWVRFETEDILNQGEYPFAVKIATGKINAVTGCAWTDELQNQLQDYMAPPNQPWLNGYCIERGIIRQFVAMPLGSGYSAEEQITGEAEYGGMQIVVYPMKREFFEKLFPVVEPKPYVDNGLRFCSARSPAMGLGPGGRIKEEIYDDPYGFDVWETNVRSRCFVHIANSLAWKAITRNFPPTKPVSAKKYSEKGLPWFEYYNDDVKGLRGSQILKGLKSIFKKDNRSRKNTILIKIKEIDGNVDYCCPDPKRR